MFDSKTKLAQKLSREIWLNYMIHILYNIYSLRDTTTIHL